MDKDLANYFEKQLGDTVERKEDRFIIKPMPNSMGYVFGTGLKDCTQCPQCKKYYPKFRLPLITQCLDCKKDLQNVE